MSLPEERAARNEALFREVNERALSLTQTGTWAPDDLLIICECSDDRCVERITLPINVYQAVRANPRRFILVPGHDNDFEHVVVERSEGYAIVEKDGRAGHIAEQVDPRS